MSRLLAIIFILFSISSLANNNLSRRIGGAKLKEVRKNDVIMERRSKTFKVERYIIERQHEGNIKKLIGKKVSFTIYDDELPRFLEQFQIAGIEVTKGGGN